MLLIQEQADFSVQVAGSPEHVRQSSQGMCAVECLATADGLGKRPLLDLHRTPTQSDLQMELHCLCAYLLNWPRRLRERKCARR